MTKFLMVGSRALAAQAPGLLRRKPLDLDMICTEEKALELVQAREKHHYYFNANKIIIEDDYPIELDLTNRESSKLLYEYAEKDPHTIHTPSGMIASLEVLLALKTSHKYLKNSKHFWKTATDYHTLKQVVSLSPEMQAIVKLREKETYTYKHPKLNVSKQDFFNDDVPYVYDHDSIHRAVAIGEKPAYTYFAKDGEQVASDKSKFFALDRLIQLRAVLEESYVLSLERSQVPHPGAMTPRASFLYALSKVCSSITSGWFREFAYENIFEVASMYDESYMTKFQDGLSSGIVIPYTGSKY
jgi:hypothetical protein